jgi:hypothetical protein
MKIVKKNNVYFLNLEKNEDLLIDKYIFKSLKVVPIAENVVALVIEDNDSKEKRDLPKEKEQTKNENLGSKEKILKFLNNKNLSVKEKLQGSFEKLLSKEDLLVFTEMVKNKEIVLCKLSDKYKNSFYTINNKFKQTTINSEVVDNFNKNNFAILKNNKDLQDFKQEFEEKVSSGKIKGIKSFDGNTYVVDLNLFNDIKDKIMSQQTISFTLDEISFKINKDKELLKTVLEILKEEAIILEKRKDHFFLV